VLGFVAAIASAQLVQWRWFRDDTGYTPCRSVAVAQATEAVRDLNFTIYNNREALYSLANTALMSGSKRTENTQLGDAFYRRYDNVVGDCRAGDTLDNSGG